VGYEKWYLPPRLHLATTAPMAKIKALPAEHIIAGFKGKLDYYLHDGLACVRKWPRSPGHRRAPAVEAGWSAFAYAAAEWKNLSPEVQDSYNRMAEGTGLSGRDMFERAYLKGVYPYPKIEEEEMKLILLDTPISVIQTGPLAAGYNWTDVDLSPHVSATATIAYIRARLLDWDTTGESDVEFFIRGKGTANNLYCLRWWRKLSAGQVDINDIFVAMDASKFIQHRLTMSAGLTNLYTRAWLLGYME